MDVLDACVMEAAGELLDRSSRCMEGTVRQDAPRDTGGLAQSISANRTSDLEFELRQDSGKAPHGEILDKASGRTISPVSAEALRFNVGGRTVFASSVEQSTEHVDWWSGYDFESEWTDCLRVANR